MNRRRTTGTAVVVAVLVPAVLVVSGCSAGSQSVATTPSRTVSSMPSGSAMSSVVAAVPGPFLWPFADSAAMAAWQSSATTAVPADVWHLDAEQTAQRFARDFLGYTELDKISSSRLDGVDAWIGVGSTGDGPTPFTAGVLHLMRADTSATAPWEVVGTLDGDLTITSPTTPTSTTPTPTAPASVPPTAAATPSSPLTVTGVITGVDESLHVQLRTVGGVVLGEVKGISAGGEKQPWTARVPFSAAPRGTVTVAVSTGGHLQRVEMFAVAALHVT